MKGRAYYRNPRCPQDEAHGELMSWPTSIAAFYCPHVSHVGGHFYRTDLSPSSPAPSRAHDPAVPVAVRAQGGASVDLTAGAPPSPALRARRAESPPRHSEPRPERSAGS